LDLLSELQKHVIDDFVSEYIAGRTPNPCVRCNTLLKWGSLFQKAQMLECDYIATGHYARILSSDEDFQLFRAENPDKDQSYALWGIPRENLPKTLLPLGSLKKEEVREIATQLELKSAETPESQEICFIPDNDYGQFLRAAQPDIIDNLSKGDLIEETGTTVVRVGSHAGYPFYTVGQRRGLGGGFTEPRYVLRTEPKTNCVVIGTKEKLFKMQFIADQTNWLIDPPAAAIQSNVQVRYRSIASSAMLTLVSGAESNTVVVHFDNPVEAIAPGQSAVFYQGDRVIGGGRILEAL
jgi:tRNA-specific 2-thiouridylase